MPLDLRDCLEEKETNEEVVDTLIEPGRDEAEDEHNVHGDVSPGAGPCPLLDLVWDRFREPMNRKET